MPVMNAPWDFMKSPKSVNIYWNPWFSIIFNILLIVTTSSDLDDTEPTIDSVKKIGSNLFKRLWNERFRGKNYLEQLWINMPVMIALWDFMKSPKSIKMLDFHQFWSFCWIWPHLEISTTPNRPGNVEKHANCGSNFFKRLWNVRFRG